MSHTSWILVMWLFSSSFSKYSRYINLQFYMLFEFACSVMYILVAFMLIQSPGCHNVPCHATLETWQTLWYLLVVMALWCGQCDSKYCHWQMPQTVQVYCPTWYGQYVKWICDMVVFRDSLISSFLRKGNF